MITWKTEYDHKPKILFTNTDSLLFEMICFSNYSTKSKYCGNSNKLVIGKIKDETRGIAIEEFVGLKQKTSWLLVDKSEHKKSKVEMKILLQQ